MKLIIQIPCYNEKDTLASVIDEIPRRIQGISSIETLVVDDGSQDSTHEVANKCGVTYVIRHRSNQGLAAAYRTGIQASLKFGADIIVNTDGDNQYPGKLIADLVKPIVEGNAELVVGDRRPGYDLRNSVRKRFLQRVGRRVISLLAGQELADPVSGFRAISRDAAFRIHVVTGYSYTIETLLQAVHKGIAVSFVPIETNKPTRPSRLFKSLTQFVGRSAATALRIFFMYHSLHILFLLSCALAIVGGIPILRFLYLFAVGEGAGHTQSLVLGGVSIILACLVLIAGLLADANAVNRIMIEESLERIQRMEIESSTRDDCTNVLL